MFWEEKRFISLGLANLPDYFRLDQKLDENSAHRMLPGLALEDPVHSVSLQQFVYEKLKAQQAMMGDQNFGVLMETVDTELVRQLQEFLQAL